ncbi:MAG: hypothetical protein MJE66_03750 [Proteobacteria bacterium]|nr:hypothetical protein [Pseudomonadota bacterium]
MPATRRVQAVFDGVRAARSEQGVGVWLGFLPRAARIDIDRIDHYAHLGPELEVSAIEGLGKVLRILRAARVAAPRDPKALCGREREAAELLRRAVGTSLVLELRPRSRLRFVAWTENGVETVDHVTEVYESPDAYLVMRRRGRFPVRVPRDVVVRQRTECERWYDVLAIERA